MTPDSVGAIDTVLNRDSPWSQETRRAHGTEQERGDFGTRELTELSLLSAWRLLASLNLFV